MLGNFLNLGRMLLSPLSGNQSTGLGSAPSGYGQQYDDLFAANPYRNLNYNSTWIQSIMSLLGLRTGLDTWREQAQVNSNEYDAGIFSMMQQNDYNDPSSQAARMRVAGQNPDLLGTGDVAGAASPVEDPNGMQPNPNSEIRLGQFATGLLSAFSTGLSLVKDFGSLAQIRNAVDMGNVEASSALTSFIQDSILSFTPAKGFDTNEDYQRWKEALPNDIFYFAEGQGWSKRLLSRLKNQVGMQMSSLPASLEQYKLFNERVKQGREYRVGQGDHWSEDIDLIHSVVEPLREAASTIREVSANVDVEILGNELAFQQGIDIGAEVSAYNQANEAVRSRKSIDDILNSALEKVMTNLENDAKKGGFTGAKAEAILLIMSLLQMQMIPSPSFSRNKSSFSGRNGEGSSSGFSFGLGF